MINVGQKFREELDKPFRSGISCEFVLQAVDKSSTALATFDLDTEGSALDESCYDGYGYYNDGVYDTFDANKVGSFKDFTSFEPNTYNSFNPKRLWRAPDSTEDDYTKPGFFQYLKDYSSRIISADFYTQPTTETNPFFTKSIIFDNDSLGKITGLTFNFGTDPTIYPTKIIVEAFEKDGTSILKKEFSPQSNSFSTIFSTINVKKLTLKVLEMSKPNVKLRISSWILGIEKKIKDELISYNVIKSSNPITTELPKNEITVQFFDEEGLFDPQNPNGIYYSLSNAIIRQYYVYDNEKYLFGTYFVSTSPTRSGITVTIKGESEVFYKIKTSKEKRNGSVGDSLATLGDLVATGNQIELDTNLVTKGFQTGRNYSYIKNESDKDIISKIANAAFAMYKEDENGFATIFQAQPPKSYPSKIKELNDNLISGEIQLDTSSPIPNGIAIQMYEQGTGKKSEVYGDGNFFLDNNFIASNSAYYNIITTIESSFDWWVDGTQKYEIPYMADPTIEIGDCVSFYNKYRKKIYGIVCANKYSFPESIGSDSLTVYTIKNVFPKNKGNAGIYLTERSGEEDVEYKQAGVRFNVYDNNNVFCGTVETDQNGYAYYGDNNLSSGLVFQFVYVSGLAGSYKIMPETFYVTVDADRPDVTGWTGIPVYNNAGGIAVSIQNAAGQEEWQSGIKLIVWRQKDDSYFTITTNRKGYAWFGTDPDNYYSGFYLDPNENYSIKYESGYTGVEKMPNGWYNSVRAGKGELTWLTIQTTKE